MSVYYKKYTKKWRSDEAILFTMHSWALSNLYAKTNKQTNKRRYLRHRGRRHGYFSYIRQLRTLSGFSWFNSHYCLNAGSDSASTSRQSDVYGKSFVQETYDNGGKKKEKTYKLTTTRQRASVSSVCEVIYTQSIGFCNPFSSFLGVNVA